MTQRDVRPTGDRELEQYLEGGSKLSRRYRDASGEGAPPDLDEAILAQARAELRRKPNLNPWLASMALAASLVLGVNLAWNLYQSAPQPGETLVLNERLAKKKASDDFVPEPPALASPEPSPQPQSKARAPAEVPAREALRERDAGLAAREEEKRLDVAQAQQRAAMAREQATESESQRRETMSSRDAAGASAYAAPAPAIAPMAALADAAPMPEAQKIDHLINHIGNLAGATFVRNGKDYGATEAAKHLQYKREKAGDRIKTADDFIRLCASHSFLSGDAYLIRFADGRTRTAEDVLREELSRIEAR